MNEVQSLVDEVFVLRRKVALGDPLHEKKDEIRGRTKYAVVLDEDTFKDDKKVDEKIVISSGGSASKTSKLLGNLLNK